MKKYISVAAAQKIDRLAQERFGIPSIVLMENAGRAVAEEVLAELSLRKNRKVLIVCGHGNNAGDGFVAGRHLINRGVDTEIVLIGGFRALKGDALINEKILKAMKARIRPLKNFAVFKEKINRAGLIVDAIFGIGIKGEPREPYKTAIDLINSSGVRVVAVDVPSGLDATTGKIPGVAIKAAKTVTFVFPKTGFIKNHGPLCCGKVVVRDIK